MVETSLAGEPPLSALRVYAWVAGAARLVGEIESTCVSWPPARRSSRFRYARKWLEAKDAFAIDPLRLPMIRGWQPTQEGEQLPGVIRDAAPDGWGKLLTERRYPGCAFGMIEYVATTEDHRIGCLAFGLGLHGPQIMDPFGRPAKPEPELSLADLVEAADRVEDGKPLPVRLEPFYARASSIGGARPKASIVDDDKTMWIAKFPMRDDDFEVERVEAACLDMAEAAGIPTPDRRLAIIGTKPLLLVKRFDRVADQGVVHRLSYMSAETAFGSPPTSYATTASYGDLAAMARKLGTPAGADVFRRMLLNVVVGNTDDHLRNHAFIRGINGRWHLSPVYDVVPHPRRRETILRLGLSHAVDLADAFSAHAAIGLRTDEAETIFRSVVGIGARWRAFMAARGVSELDIGRLEPAFAVVNNLNQPY